MPLRIEGPDVGTRRKKRRPTKPPPAPGEGRLGGGPAPPPRSRLPGITAPPVPGMLPSPVTFRPPPTPAERRVAREGRRIEKEIRKGLKLTHQQRLNRYGFLGASYLANVKDEMRAVERMRKAESAAKAADARRLREWREKSLLDKNLARWKAYGGVVSGLAGSLWGEVEKYDPRATRASALRPRTGQTRGFGEALMASGLPTTAAPDLAEVAAKLALGVPAGLYGAARYPSRVPRDIRQQAAGLVQTPALLLAASDPRVSKEARRRLTEQVVQEGIKGFTRQYGPGIGWRESARRSAEVPVTSVLAGAGLVAGPAARAASIGAGVRAGLPLPEAIEASSRPYLRGPEYERTLRLRGGPAGRGRDVTIEWARHPLWRPLQRGYDALSRRIPSDVRVLNVISEPVRAGRALRKEQGRIDRRLMAVAENAYDDIRRLPEAEQRRLLATRDKPPMLSDELWLSTLIEDMKEMVGGRDVITPARGDTPGVARAKRRIAYLEKRLDTALNRRVERILGAEMAPLATRSQSLRQSIRVRRRKGEDTSALERELYDVNARLELAKGEKVRPVRDSPERQQFARAVSEQLGQERVGPLMQVADALARSAEPDNPAKWYEQRLAETTLGTPEDVARLVAQGDAVFQREGYSWGLVRVGEGPPQRGDLVWPRGEEDAWIVTGVNEDGSLAIALPSPGSQWASARAVISPDEVESVVNLPQGRSVVTRSGQTGEVVSHDSQQRTTTIKGGDGSFYEIDTADLAPTHAPVFYSHAQRVVEEKGQPKATPEQWAKLFEKNGVKQEEMEWSGINDYIEDLRVAGVKSVAKEDVQQFLANPLNAFDLAEVVFKHDSSSYGSFHTRWGSYGEEGLVVRDPDIDYRELVLTIPKERLYSHGHWSGVTNPLVHIRYHIVERGDGNTLLVDELQSDWHQDIQKYGMLPKNVEQMLSQIRAEATGFYVKQQELAAKFGLESDAPHQDLYRLMTQMLGDVQEYVTNTPGTTIQQASERSGLNEVTKAYRISERWEARKRALQDTERGLTRGKPAAPFASNRWIELAFKRLVALAAREDIDRIEWTAGHVQVVRYESFDGGLDDELGSSDASYETPEDHPYYPDSDNYSNEYALARHSFALPPDASGLMQERLFGYPDRPSHWDQGQELREVTWNDPWGVEPEAVPVEQSMPIRLDPADLGEHMGEDYVWLPGRFVTPQSGALENVHLRIIGTERDGTLLVEPTGVTQVAITGKRGTHYDGQDFDMVMSDRTGRILANEEVEGVSTSAYISDAVNDIDSPMFNDILDAHWFDDFDREFDRSWESEFDEEGFNYAVREWESEYGDEIGGTGETDFATIDNLDDPSYYSSSGQGTAHFYDSVIPNTVRKLFKADKIEVERSRTLGRYSTQERGVITPEGPVPVWGFNIPTELKAKALEGQRLFQASHHGQIKGAVEFLGGERMAMRLFESADTSTVLHELGHIALYDMDDLDVDVLDRDLAEGRSFKRGEWNTEDHERYARAWERYFLEGRASTTALRGVFQKLMQWMRLIYDSARGLDARISPEVEAVFNKRLGKVDVQEADVVKWAGRFDKEVVRWGTLVANAKNELEALEARMASIALNGTDDVLKEEKGRLEAQRREATDEVTHQELSERIDAIDNDLREREAIRVSRGDRREKLLRYQLDQLEKAFAAGPTSERYDGAVAAADWFQMDRENVLREVLGEAYDAVFEGRRKQMSQWLAERGHLPEDLVGEGRGFLPFTREQRRNLPGRGTAPTTRKFGKQSTASLNLHKRNEMILWQLGDYRADPKVLLESWARAQAFKWQRDLRQLLYDIGEDVGRGGPKDGWYLINLEGKPLPKEWQSALNDDEQVASFLNDLEGGNDEGVATRLNLFARNWISRDKTDFLAPDGTYPNVRQVHPSIVHSLLLPYQGRSAHEWLPGAADQVNSIARLSLIYANPGYIPSNVFANSILGMANSPWFLKDMGESATIMVNEGKLSRLIAAEMGSGSLQALLPEQRGIVRRAEQALVKHEKVPADDWPRIAAWISTARRNGYRGREEMWRLLTSKDARVQRDRDFISREATQVMIDFDRLGPTERRYLQSFLFVWPFIRGATAWPFTYIRDFPERAAIAAAATAGYGEQAREELGDVPPYYPTLAPISVDKKSGVGTVANMQSVAPLGPLAEIMGVAFALGASVVSDEQMPTFQNLFDYIAPQYQATALLLQGRTQFGQEAGLRTIAAQSWLDLVPGAGLITDVLDETKPAIYTEQDLRATLLRRTFRFSPQTVSLNTLNQLAEERGAAETPQQKTTKLIKQARAAWSRGHPTEAMPRSVELSIRAFYAHSEARAQKQEEIKRSGAWRPKRGERTPKLTPIQEATVTYDILNAYFPNIVREESLPDPEDFLRQYGEDALEVYTRNMRTNMFRLKGNAQEIIRNQKEARKAGVAP